MLAVPEPHRTQFVRLLDLGLIMRWTEFPGFGAAFDPGDIRWDIDAEPFVRDKGHVEDGAFETKPHPPKCWRGKHCSHVQIVMSNAVNPYLYSPSMYQRRIESRGVTLSYMLLSSGSHSSVLRCLSYAKPAVLIRLSGLFGIEVTFYKHGVIELHRLCL